MVNSVHQFPLTVPWWSLSNGAVLSLTRPLNSRIFNYYYPERPKSHGQGLREDRIEAELTGWQLTEEFEVTECAVYNWEVKGMRPLRKEMARRVNEFVRHHQKD